MFVYIQCLDEAKIERHLTSSEASGRSHHQNHEIMLHYHGNHLLG